MHKRILKQLDERLDYAKAIAKLTRDNRYNEVERDIKHANNLLYPVPHAKVVLKYQMRLRRMKKIKVGNKVFVA